MFIKQKKIIQLRVIFFLYLIYEQKIFNYNVIKTLKKQVLSKNPEDSPAKIWALVVFQYWWKKYYC